MPRSVIGTDSNGGVEYVVRGKRSKRARYEQGQAPGDVQLFESVAPEGPPSRRRRNPTTTDEPAAGGSGEGADRDPLGFYVVRNDSLI